MDPRLNPHLNPNHPPVPPATAANPPQPMAAPAPQAPPAQAPTPAPAPAPVPTPAPPTVQKPLAQIVDTIPVRQPGSQPQTAVAAEPRQQMPGTSAPQPAADPAKPHDDLDKILQAVNNRVATP